MNIIALQGSPRKGGNTETLLNEAVRAIEEEGIRVRVFELNSMNIQPCQDCGGCDDTGCCIINDDMDEIYEAIRNADRVMVASPVFFFNVSAQTKAMIDRSQAFWCEKYLLKRPIPAGPRGRKGLFLLVGGMKKDAGITCSEATVTAFMRTISVPEHKSLYYLGVDEKGAIIRHPTALKDAYGAGKELIR
jgi:multimeric flavodoxin WrbA